MLTTGQVAPDFELMDQDNKPVRLSNLLERGTVVLYFYPKDETAGCTAEACSFRDNYEIFGDAGAQVVGVSRDSVASHRSFANHHRLPFTLLSDPGGKVADEYGVERALFGLTAGRSTFVIDKTRVIRHTFTSLVMATKHVGEALAVVKRLNS